MTLTHSQTSGDDEDIITVMEECLKLIHCDPSYMWIREPQLAMVYDRQNDPDYVVASINPMTLDMMHALGTHMSLRRPDIVLLDTKEPPPKHVPWAFTPILAIEIDGSVHHTRAGNQRTIDRNKLYHEFGLEYIVLDKEYLEVNKSLTLRSYAHKNIYNRLLTMGWLR